MQVISTENAAHYEWGDGCHGWHLLSSAQLSIIQERVPAGSGEVRHYHQHAEQFFFILSGIATLQLDGVSYRLHAQQGLQVPAGISHQLSNQGDRDCWFIVASSPPSHGDRIQV